MATKKENQTAELLPQQGECVVGKFTGKDVRKTFHNNEWCFSIVDVIDALVNNDNPNRYWSDLKTKMLKEEHSQLYDFIVSLDFPSKKDGKNYKSDASGVEGILRIIQSIPSKSAEPFKRWLAKTGFERIKERENPHLAIKRAMLDYELQGRSKKWIQTRVQGIITRNKLTDEWKDRKVKEGVEYDILTDAISEGTFGIKTKEHK